MDNKRLSINTHATRWHDAAYWGLMLVVCILFYIMNCWTSFKEDDMEFSLLRNAGFMDFLRAQYDHYMTANGRCADFFATLFCAYLGKPLFNVVNTLMFAGMAHLVSLLSTGRRSVLVLALFIAYVGLWFPVPGQTMLFVAGSCNYMWAIVASLLMVYLLRKYSRQPRPGKIKTILLILLAFVAGNFNEATSFGFFGGLVLYYLFNRKEINRTVVLVLLSYLAGLVVIMGSPAAWQRASTSVVVDLSFKDLLMSRAYIFAKMMVRIVAPALAVLVGCVMLVKKSVRPLLQCLWTYILPCLMLLMIALGYLYDRAYAPMATVGFIILAMVIDSLTARRSVVRLAVIILCLAVSALYYPPRMKVLRDLKQFEDRIASDIAQAPSQAVLHEYVFNGSSPFATPLRYVSREFFNRESTYRAYFGKENVQFVDDSVYARYHEGRLLDGAKPLPMVSDRPEIADTVLLVAGQDYMIIPVKGDTLPASPQLAIYHLKSSNRGLSPEEIKGRKRLGIDTDFSPYGCYPLFYQGQQLLVLPTMGRNVSHITIQLDYMGELGELTLTPTSPKPNI